MSHVANRLHPTAQDLSRLINLTYRCGLEPDLMHDFVLAMQDTIGTQHIFVLFNIDPKNGRVGGWHQADKKAMDDYNAYYSWHDPNVLVLPQLPEGCVTTTERSLMPWNEYTSTEVYNDWYRPLGMGHGMAGTIDKGQGHLSTIGIGWDLHAPDVSVEHLNFVSRLMPHLQSVIRIQRRLGQLETNRTMLASGLDTLPYALLILDSHAHPVVTNERMREVLRDGQGLSYSRPLGVHCGRIEDTRQLQTLIHGAIRTSQGHLNGSAGGFMAIRREARQPLEALVTPLPPDDPRLSVQQGAVALFIADPAHASKSLATQLQALHGLTPGEARVAEHLVGGESPREIADTLELSIHTVRSHIKRLLAATGASRQGQLLAQLTTGLSALDHRK